MSLDNRKNYILLVALLEIRKDSFCRWKDVEAASIYSNESHESNVLVRYVALDGILNFEQKYVVIQIDVEGYETCVLRGATNIINNKHPLIIFEYNHVSKKHFNISDNKGILGYDYSVYRLRIDAKLDIEVEKTWNCVAIPHGSVYQYILTDFTV